MIKSLMYHKVEDFNKWKAAFDSFYQFRKNSGEQSYSVGTIEGDPNNVYVINDWNSMAEFEAFVQSPELAEAMKNAGVLEPPHKILLNEADKG